MRSPPERQLEVVYTQLARTTGFRGFRPKFLWSVAFAAACATVFALLLSRTLSERAVVLVWSAVAAAMATAVAFSVVLPALRAELAMVREAARSAANQMIPPVGIGGILTALVLTRHAGAIEFLPSIWLVLFGLGVGALSPLILARLEIVVAFYFLAAAASYLLRTDDPATFSLLVGGAFALGHVVTALLVRSAQELESSGTRDE